MPSTTGYDFTGAGGLVTTRLLGLLARPMALVFVQVTTQASPWLALNVRLTLAPALVAPRLLGWARGNAWRAFTYTGTSGTTATGGFWHVR